MEEYKNQREDTLNQKSYWAYGIHFMDVENPMSALEELKNMALVGTTKDLESLKNLKRNIDAERFPDIEIKYVGGLSVLLVFLEL